MSPTYSMICHIAVRYTCSLKKIQILKGYDITQIDYLKRTFTFMYLLHIQVEYNCNNFLRKTSCTCFFSPYIVSKNKKQNCENRGKFTCAYIYFLFYSQVCDDLFHYWLLQGSEVTTSPILWGCYVYTHNSASEKFIA